MAAYETTLSDLLASRNWSQAHFLKIVNDSSDKVTQTRLSNFIRGVEKISSPRWQERAASLFSVPVEAIFRTSGTLKDMATPLKEGKRIIENIPLQNHVQEPEVIRDTEAPTLQEINTKLDRVLAAVVTTKHSIGPDRDIDFFSTLVSLCDFSALANVADSHIVVSSFSTFIARLSFLKELLSPKTYNKVMGNPEIANIIGQLELVALQLRTIPFYGYDLRGFIEEVREATQTINFYLGDQLDDSENTGEATEPTAETNLTGEEADQLLSILKAANKTKGAPVGSGLDANGDGGNVRDNVPELTEVRNGEALPQEVHSPEREKAVW